MKLFLMKTGLAVLRFFCGVTLVDQRTGKVIGRVVVIRWKGGLRLIGLEGAAVRPHFLLQQSERYWAQDLGFSSHPAPDFPHVENRHPADLPSDTSRGVSHVPDVAGPES
jgi:hypothetical protein